MIKMNKQIILITALLIASFTPVTQAEGLGRLFTTPKERAMLEELRLPRPKTTVKKHKPTTVVDPDKLESLKKVITQPDPIKKQEPVKNIVIIPAPIIPKITVNGFVKRSGGRSTAWVNGINTNDGYFDPQHIKVNPHRIGRDHVHVEVDDINIGDVSMKVGQTLDPEVGKITDSYQKMLGKPDVR